MLLLKQDYNKRAEVETRFINHIHQLQRTKNCNIISI